MAAQDKATFKQDLTEPVKIRHYEGVVFTGDDCGNLIKVALFDGGTPYSGGGTVSATAVLADGTTFPLTQGSLTGNMVSVPLEAGALVVSGLMGLYVKISGDGIICTVLNAIFTVQATDTGMVPAAMVTTVNELVQEIKDAQDSFPADLTNLLAAVAPTFRTSTAYSAGAYVWQGGKLYRFTAAHPAGTWTGTDAAAVALGNDVSDLKSAVDEMGLVETPFETTWEIGGLNTTGAGSTASNRVRNKPAFTVRKRQKIVVDSSVEIRICYYKTSDSSYDHWNSTGYATGTFELEYGYKARILGRYVADPTSDISSVTPFYTLIQIITDTYKEVPSVDDTLSISGDAADAKATGDAISQIAENLGTSSEEIEITNTLQTYWSVESTTAVKTSVSAQFQASDPIPVKPGEVYTITSRQGETHKARIWTVTDDDYTIISMAEDYYDTVLRTNVFSIPEGGTKLLLTKQLNATPQKLVKHADGINIVTYPFRGKKLSLLGDSISAYTGTVPSGYAVYYTGSNSGVSSPDQMWWSVLCEKTGMEPLVINGLSGSAVTQLEDSSHVNKIPMSSDERCNGLHTEAATPDVIIIAGGVNDYTYAQSAQSEPLDWNGKTAPVLGNSFTEAYACMIKKLQTNYPNALIIALSSWFTMRGTDNGYTLTHTVGNNVYTQKDYNDKIRFVAEQMHIPYIDVSNIGFNRNNFYPNYAQDSSTIPTHPNASGHYVMASAIASKMLAIANGYFN